MNDLAGKQGEVHATITIVRAGTGKVETYELVGHTDPEKLAEIMKNKRQGNDPTPQSSQEPQK